MKKKILLKDFCLAIIFIMFLQMSFNTVLAQDEWPMFQHDFNNSGYSTSQAPNGSNVIWSQNPWSVIWWCNPVVAYNKLYIGGEETLFCFNAENGEKVWDFVASGLVDAVALDENKVYFLSNDLGGPGANIYCLDANNGDKIWNETIPFVNPGGAPKIAYGKIYVGLHGGLFCLDADNGLELWNFTGVRHDWIDSSPAIVDNKVYFGSWDSKVYCIDANDGHEIWNFTTKGIVSSSPSIYAARVYVTCNDNNLYCLDAGTGIQFWNFTTGADIYSSTAVGDGKVYFGARDNKLHCIDSDTGEEIWNYTVDSAVDSSPVIADGKVYFGGSNHKIYCVNASSGSYMWSYSFGYGVGGPDSFAVANNRLYCADVGVYCFGGSGVSSSSFGNYILGFSIILIVCLIVLALFWQRRRIWRPKQ